MITSWSKTARGIVDFRTEFLGKKYDIPMKKG